MKYTISAVILAGGKARRMNGADKGLQLLQNKPLISHVIERLQPQVIDISINANRHHTEYAQWGFPVFSDELPDFQGPLSGMLTALEKAKTDFVLISVSIRCNSRSLELLFMDLTEIFIPSMIGLINVIKVQIAAIPIAPAPMKRTLDFQTAIANLAVAPPSGAKILVK